MTRDDVLKAIAKQTVENATVIHRYEGIKRLFDAACMCGDTDAQDKCRLELHCLLDMMLDGSTSITVLTKKLAETPQ